MNKELPSPTMDNFQVSVTARGKETLLHVVQLVMSEHSTVVAYQEVPNSSNLTNLNLFWYHDKDKDKAATKLLYPYNIPQATEFIWGWLGHANYGPEPDIDGSCTRGWKLSNHGCWGWSHISFIIEPIWAEHHK